MTWIGLETGKLRDWTWRFERESTPPTVSVEIPSFDFRFAIHPNSNLDNFIMALSEVGLKPDKIYNPVNRDSWIFLWVDKPMLFSSRKKVDKAYSLLEI